MSEYISSYFLMDYAGIIAYDGNRSKDEQPRRGDCERC